MLGHLCSKAQRRTCRSAWIAPGRQSVPAMLFPAMLLCLLCLCGLAPVAADSGSPELEREVIVDESGQPWAIAVTPIGDVLYTAKCKGLYVVPLAADGGYEDPIFLFGPEGAAVDAPDTFCEGQSGYNGVAVDPEFSSNGYIYVFAPSTLSARPSNRIIRLTLSEDLTTVGNREDIVTDIFYKVAATGNGREGAHSGGRIKFGPDGYLYIATGDNHNATLPQDLNAMGGKVMRVDRTGAAAPENQPPAGGDPRIYTYGHRNVQGIAFHPVTGQPYTAEHGPGYDDEVTALLLGGNAGWDPQDRPGLDCPDNYCGYSGTPESMPMTDTGRFPDAMPPAWVYTGSQRGMGPNVFLEGSHWGSWENKMLVGIMAAGELWLLTINETTGLSTEEVLVSGEGDPVFPPTRYRGLTLGPDDALYIATEESFSGPGEVVRVAPPGWDFASVVAASPGSPAGAPGAVEGVEGEEGGTWKGRTNLLQLQVAVLVAWFVAALWS